MIKNQLIIQLIRKRNTSRIGRKNKNKFNLRIEDQQERKAERFQPVQPELKLDFTSNCNF